VTARNCSLDRDHDLGYTDLRDHDLGYTYLP
jgi:hypothetical protein